ncbi:hypothetical protein BKA56DRAFT_671994 [Ilyonectria sp. MPI-CAGE-AT-0026]|nr:hypothetical protein BKA56DRAFT_671994 [Ilyonectria sp. MPI-CAGE-AT-0026]
MDVAKSLSPTNDDLWAAAVGTLGEELTSQIDFNQETKQNALSELLAATEEARACLVDRSWSFKRKNGEKVIVRDVLAKVAKWVSHFKEVGDIAVQYDPVHAALPWAGVRFLLNIAIGDLKTYNTLLESTADIAEYICRNVLVESLLKDYSSPAADELSRALVKLYAAILVYLARAKSYYNQNTLKRVLKHGVLAPSDLESTFTAIGKAQEGVDRCFANFNLQEAQLKMHDDLKRMLKHFDAPVKRWDEALKAITDQLDAKKRGKILHWISPEPYKQHHEQTKSEVLEGTGKWLLQDPTFLKWKNESASSILWLRGIPGSGKSKLTSIVVEDAQHAFRRNQTPAPVYFYCSRNPAEPGRSDPSMILASIARQLSTPQIGGSILEPTVEAYKQRNADAFASGPLRLGESKDLVLKLLDRYKDATMTVVIDGLDECNEATRGMLLDTLEELLGASPCLLKIFVSSRNDQDIVFKLVHYPNLELSSNHNSADIDLFVHSETKRLVNNGSLLRFSMRKEELQNKIIHELTSNADGMFRWASLQLQALQQHRTDEAILERLGRLPRTLAELYKEVLSKIENFEAAADRRVARNALSWMLCSRKRLRSDDFLVAVSLTRDRSTSAISRDQLLGLCCNLVNFDSTVDTFRFSHLSVREFLEAQDMYRTTSVNAIVTEACIFHIMGVTAENAPPTPLLKLAASRADIPSILLVVCAFNLYGVLSPGQWRQLAQRKPLNKDGATHQEVAVRHGGPELLEWHFSNKIPFQITDETVQAAAENEYNGVEVMALLLNKCETEIHITKDIIRAAARNWTSGGKVMALLLDKHGAEMQITGDIVVTIVRSFNKTIFSGFLDKHGAAIQITEDVVKAAAESEKVMALLLDKCGAEIQITEDIIKAAAAAGNKGVMALLLDKCRVEIQITEDIIKAAAAAGNKGVMALLLDKYGAEIQITEDIIKAAARNLRSGREVMALLLDKYGAEIQITEDVIKTAAGNEKVMAMLLDKRGADIQITEDVLKAAVGNEGYGNVVALFLEKRRSETITAITDNVCLTAAAFGKVDTLGFLCHLIPPETVDPSWNSIASFYRSAERGDVGRIKQLLQEPIPKDAKNSRGQTPLWIAAFKRRTDIVKILAREKDIDVDSLSASGQSPIFWPSAFGYEEIVGILVSVGAKSHFIADNGQTAVSMARRNGHERIVRVLLDAQSAQRHGSVSVGKKLWWGRLSLSASLIFLGFIFYQTGWIGGESLLTMECLVPLLYLFR